MTKGIVIGLLVVLALFGLELLWDWRRSGRLFCVTIPRRFRKRESREALWRERCGHDNLADINALLTSLCEAFSFNPDDRWQFSPKDQVMDIYRACYPRWKLWLVADSMEIESLMMDLEKQYGLGVADWRPEISLGEIFSWQARNGAFES